MKKLIEFFLIITFSIFVGLVLSLPTKWMINYLFNPTLLATIFTTGKFTLWHAWSLNILLSSLTTNVFKESK